MTKAKKARLDIKTELIDTVVDDEQHEEISYVETTDLDKQMCVTAEEREVLEREGKSTGLSKQLIRRTFDKWSIFRVGTDGEELEKSTKKDQEQNLSPRVEKT